MIPRKGPRSVEFGLSQFTLAFKSLQLQRTHACRCYANKSNSQTTVTTLKRAIGRGNIHHARYAYENMLKQQQNKVERDVVRKLLLLARHGKRNQDVDFMNKVINDMKCSLQISPQHFEYHALIYAYGMQQNPDRAYNVLERMRREGLEPNLYTYNTLLGCYKRTNDLAEAERILQEMQDNDIKFDTVTYNTILHMLLRRGEFEKLFSLYDKMMSDAETVRPDIYTYSTVLDAAVKSGNQYVGQSICDQLLHQPKDIDLNMMNNILRFKSQVDFNQALDLYHNLAPHIQPDRAMYNILLDACLKNGNPGKAYTLFGEMKKFGLKADTITYGTLIDAEAKMGNLRGALDLFQDMCQASIEPNDRIITSLVNIASAKTAAMKELDEVVEIAEKFQRRLDTKAYNALMYGLALNGKSRQVQHLYDTVFRHVTCQPDVATFTHLILAYINDDQLDDAMEIYYTLREHHKKCLSNSSKVKIPIQLDTTFYSTLIATLSKDISNASQPQPTDDEYDSSPRLITAMTMFNDMRPLQVQPTIHIYTAMLHACGQYRDRYILNQIHQQIKVDLYLDPDIGIYNALMDAYSRTGDGDMVLDIWQTISMPASVSDVTPDQISVSIIFDSCGHNGLTYRAHGIWEWLKRTEFQLNTNNYNSYIECLCRERGRQGWDKARQLVEQDMSSKPMHGKVSMDEKTVNTLISFAKKKKFDDKEIESLDVWKSQLLL